MSPVQKFAFMVLTTLVTLTGAEPEQGSILNEVKETKTVINEVTYVPPMMILGFKNGTISRCPHARPNSCEVLYFGNEAVSSTVVHGEFLFASLTSGAMLRCHWQKKHSCSKFNQASSEITGLAVALGFIHAGLRNGTILRCDLNTPDSCWVFATLETNRQVRSLMASGSSIYAGSDIGRIDRCSETGCQQYSQTDFLYNTGLAMIEGTVYGLKQVGIVDIVFSNGTCDFILITGSSYRQMAAYGRQLYVIQDPGVIYIIDHRTIHPNDNRRSQFVEHPGVISVSFAYGTYAMQEQYKKESKECIWRDIFQCPPYVVYFDVHQRFTWEVTVKNGSLYNSQAVLVDTSNADVSYSQKAAIFVMGPDGQLLLSNAHKTGLLHTSSLLAGNPVSGAGLMVVEKGKIKSITSCSAHYRPEPELNNQVIEALYLQGYTDPIDIYPCSYRSMLSLPDSSNIGNQYRQ